MEALSGHVILCGLNSLGFRVAEQLHLSGEALVVIDDDYAEPALRRRLERWAVPMVADSAHSAETLLETGIGDAAAIIACADSDLVNLQTALLAAELAPGLRLVVRCANPQLGEQIQAALPPARVLSLAGMAGPSFVEACVRSDVLHAFRVGSEVLQVVDVPVTSPGPFRQVYGNLTPISLRRPGQAAPEVCPSRDALVEPGDRLALLGRAVDFAENHIRVEGERDTPMLAALSSPGRDTRPPGRPRRGFRRWLRDITGTVAAELDRPFRVALGVAVTVTLVSTLVLALTYRDSFAAPHRPRSFTVLDALYLTVQTMAAVGYGDFAFGGAATWLKVYGVVLMLVGVASLSTFFAFVTNVVVSRRLEHSLGRGRATTTRDHVIMSGLGAVGVAVMEGLLSAGRQVVVIERHADSRYLPAARARGVPVVLGDATVRATLRQAGIARAATLAAVAGDQVANLEAVLSAREAFAEDHPDDDCELRVVLRMFDADLAEEVERRFGIHTVRSASALAAPWFVGAALGYEVVSTFYVERQPFLVARMRVAAGGGLDGPTLQELSTGTRMLAVATGTTGQRSANYRPTRHTRLRPGDEVLLVGPYAQIIATFRRNQQAPADRRAARTATG